MKIDWTSFLNDHAISYRTEGKNTALGHVNIKCPFCGHADPSEHMGINLETGKYGCWRNAGHRGKNPVRLVAEVLNIPWDQARQALQPYAEGTLYHGDKRIRELLCWAQGETTPMLNDHIDLQMPASFLPLKLTTYSGVYSQYLIDRGFKRKDINDLGRSYWLLIGAENYARRIIFPVCAGGRLVTWSGRAVYPNMEPRYKTLSPKQPDYYNRRAVAPITNYLAFQDSLCSGGNALFITEGPFDALKMDYYARQYGVRCTCLFGLAVSEMQKETLFSLRDRYKKFVLLLDAAAMTQACKVQGKLQPLDTQMARLPANVDDPGELSERQVCEVLSDYL